MPADRKRVAHFLTSKYSESHQNDLTHPIHPIFDFDLWHRPGSREFLEPVLRLASVLLESPASQRFIYSRLYTDHYRKKRKPFTAQCRFRRSQAPDDAIERGFQEATLYVAKRLRYEWREFPEKAYARTVTVTGPKNTSIVSCVVEVKISHFRRILHKPVGPGDRSEIARHRFNLAVTLCHEVAHALDTLAPSQCGHGYLKVNHYFEDEKKSELGFAWEAEVFGFTAEGAFAYGETLVNFALDHPVPRYRQILALPGKSRPSSRGLAGYVIPIDYIARVQRQIFWDRSRRTMTMLRISTKMEYRTSGRCDDLPSGNSQDWVQIVGKDGTTGETTVTSLPLPSSKTDQQQTKQQETGQQQIDQPQTGQQQTQRFVGVFVPPRSSE